MTTLLLRLAGPFQAWSSTPRLPVQPTDREPTFSGVVGLVACALGRRREEPIDDLTRLQMGVRVDREGGAVVDFHTTFGGHAGRPDEPVLSLRHYLADADFLVALEGPKSQLVTIEQALHAPVWPVYLGRRSCLPSMPVTLPGGGLRDQPLDAALRLEPWSSRDGERAPAEGLRLVLPADERGVRRVDVPTSFVLGKRAFRPRFVRYAWTPAT